MKRLLILLAVLLVPTLAHAVSLTVTWTDASTNEDGFGVERKVGSAAYVEIGKTAVNVATFTDPSAPTGAVCYRVYAYNATGKSGYSNEACTTVPTLPNAPTDVKVSITIQMNLQSVPPEDAPKE